MGLLTDGLLMAATLFAGGYCWVLARRVNDLKDLDRGLGAAIVALTRQIEVARTTLEEARASASDTRHDLGQMSARAEAAAAQLRLLLAAVKEPEVVRPAAAPASVAQAEVPLVPAVSKPAAPRPLILPQALPPILPVRVEMPAANWPEPLAQTAPPRPVPVAAPDIPKPRPMPPLPGLLRRPKPEPVERSEDEIIDALRAMATGGS